jgi:hypothetical protein
MSVAFFPKMLSVTHRPQKEKPTSDRRSLDQSLCGISHGNRCASPGFCFCLCMRACNEPHASQTCCSRSCLARNLSHLTQPTPPPSLFQPAHTIAPLHPLACVTCRRHRNTYFHVQEIALHARTRGRSARLYKKGC